MCLCGRIGVCGRAGVRRLSKSRDPHQAGGEQSWALGDIVRYIKRPYMRWVSPELGISKAEI